jgi:serine/threonine protein kinase
MQTIGFFELREEIGHSATGAVYRAEDPQGRPFALKTIPYARLSDPERREFLERFHEMAAVAASLRHPGIVPIFDFGQQQGVAFLAMELVDGVDMRRAKIEFGQIPLQGWMGVLEQMAAALDACHQQGGVHGDLKPSNVLVQTDGRVRLTDFLMGRIQETRGFSQPGKVLESLAYMAPERLKTLTADPQSDEYSLAVLAFEWLSGRSPYVAGSANELMTKIVFEAPPSFLVAAPQMPASLEQVFARGLAREPVFRYPSCVEFVQAIGQALGPLLWHATESGFSWKRRIGVELAAEEQEWLDLGPLRNRGLLESFLKRHPKGRFAAEARERMAAIDAEDQAWRQIQAEPEREKLQGFLDRYQTGPYTISASRMLTGLESEQVEWAKVAGSSSPDVIGEFLTRYPQGQFTVDAQQRLAALWEEGKAWKALGPEPSPGLIQEFLKRHPDSRFRAEAEALLEPKSAALPPPPPAPEPSPVPDLPVASAPIVEPITVEVPAVAPPSAAPVAAAVPPKPKSGGRWVLAAGAGAACVVGFFLATRMVLFYSRARSQAGAPVETFPARPAIRPPTANPAPKSAASPLPEPQIPAKMPPDVAPIVHHEPQRAAAAPNTHSTPEASAPLSDEEKAWKKAQDAGNLKSYLNFLRTFPTSPNAPIAQNKIEELSERVMWESTRESVDAKVWENFLAAYPDSKQASTVRDKLTSFRAEQMAWDLVQNSNDPKAFRDFLKVYPDGRYAPQAKQRATQ